MGGHLAFLWTLQKSEFCVVLTCTYFLFMSAGYIGEFEIIDDHRAGKIVVNLTGRLNKVMFSQPDTVSDLAGQLLMNLQMY